MTNWQKIAKGTYQAFKNDDTIVIKKNCNTWVWDIFVNGIYKISYQTLQVAKLFA